MFHADIFVDTKIVSERNLFQFVYLVVNNAYVPIELFIGYHSAFSRYGSALLLVRINSGIRIPWLNSISAKVNSRAAEDADGTASPETVIGGKQK